MAQVLEGQEDACEEFRAGLVLLGMDLDEFSNLTGIKRDMLKACYTGKSKPNDATLGYMRLMIAFNIDPKVAWAINGPGGVDLVEMARSRLDPGVFERNVLLSNSIND